jgi:hypothetical protein
LFGSIGELQGGSAGAADASGGETFLQQWFADCRTGFEAFTLDQSLSMIWQGQPGSEISHQTSIASQMDSL